MKIHKFKNSRYYNEKIKNMNETEKETFEHVAYFIETLMRKTKFEIGLPIPQTNIAFWLHMPNLINNWMHKLIKTEISNYINDEIKQLNSENEIYFVTTFKEMTMQAIEQQRLNPVEVNARKIMNQNEMQMFCHNEPESLKLQFKENVELNK